MPEYLRHMDELAFQRALDAAWELLVAINGYIVTREPWKHFKEHGADEALSRIIWNTLEALRIVWVMVAPFMPASTREALARLGADPDRIDADDAAVGLLPAGAPVARRRRDLSRASTSRSTSEEQQDRTKETSRAAGTGRPARSKPRRPRRRTREDLDRQFMEVDLRVAEVRAAERVPKSKKLIKMTVFTGDDERTIVAGIAHEVHARGAGGTEGRDRGESAAGEADGSRVERHGAGRVDRRRAEPAQRRSGRARPGRK